MMNRKPILVPESLPNTSTTLTEALIEQFCRLTRKGLPADAVCDYLGISGPAYWNWIHKGRQYIEGDNKPDEYAMYGVFYQRFKKATAVYRKKLVIGLHTSKGKNWIKYIEILSRRDRKTFGRKEQEGGREEAIEQDDRYI